MSRQDRQGVRTAPDIERKYDIGKRFEEVKEAVSAASSSVVALDNKMNQSEVLNRLTNNGESRSVFMGSDGQLYINASYISRGILRSKDGTTFYLDLVNNIIKGRFTQISVGDDDIKPLEPATNTTLGGIKVGENLSITQDGTLSVAKSNILEAVYPIGAIYLSTVEANPSMLFGFGTWEQIQDTFLLAAGSTYAAGSTGGEAEHILTVEEMPPHTHSFSSFNKDGSTSSSSGAAKTAVTAETDSAGGGVAHNNMPPYLAVYVWKRTA